MVRLLSPFNCSIFLLLLWPFYSSSSFPLITVVNVTYSYADACRNIFNTIRTSEHSSLEKYTSHFIRKGSKRLRKVLCVRGELETEQNCYILTPPPIPLATAAFLFRSPGLLIPASSLQLIWLPIAPGLYNYLTPTCFQTVKVIPRYLRPDAPAIYTGAFLIWQLGRVGGQYVTLTFDETIRCFLFLELILCFSVLFITWS